MRHWTSCMDVQNSASFQEAVSNPQLGKVVSVEELLLSTVVENVDRRCFLVSCYTDRIRTVCERHRSFILILDNSYLLSFVDNLGLAWLCDKHREPLELSAFTVGFAKKFVAEQMYRIRPSSMARILFMESMLAYEPEWRKPIERKEDDDLLDRSSKRLTAMTADFLRHHEIGHTATRDTRFDVLVRKPVAEALTGLDLSDLTERERTILTEEVEADIFGLNCCIALYAGMMTEEQIREYLTFVARAAICLNMLYAYADDLHRINVDEKYRCEPVSTSYLMAAYREVIMVRHLTDFLFDTDTVEATSNPDLLLKVGDASNIFEPILAGAEIIDHPSEGVRRAAQVLDLGFADGGDFEAVINGVRSSWMLNER